MECPTATTVQVVDSNIEKMTTSQKSSSSTSSLGIFGLLLLISHWADFAMSAVQPSQVSCRKQQYPVCYGVVQTCPAACPRTCKVDCVTCKTLCSCNAPGAVCDDPRFVGGDGITFYFHGHKDRDFCLVTDDNLHINGHFIGRRGDGMKRDFTWIQSIGVIFNGHKLFIGAKKVAKWDDSVDQLSIVFDGQPVLLPNVEEAVWKPSDALPAIAITHISSVNEIVVTSPESFTITARVIPISKEESEVHGYGITDEDCFAHLDLGFKFYNLSDQVNGILGQTYAESYKSRVKTGVAMPVLGGAREFFSSSIFATDCKVSQFRGTRSSSSESGADESGFNGVSLMK